MQEYLRAVLSPLLSAPESLSISETDDDLGTFLIAKVAKQDMGIAIGREGDTVKALRTLVHLVGKRQEKRVTLRITEA